MELESFREMMRYQGYVVLPDMVSSITLRKMRDDIESWLNFAEKIRVANGLPKSSKGVAHNILGREDSMAEFIRSLPCDQYLTEYFTGAYILNSFSCLKNQHGKTGSYKHVENFHRDVRVYTADKNLMINMLVFIDEFTINNGATRLVPGSHNFEEKPSNEYMETHSIHVTGGEGSIVLFNSNVWHSASKNIDGGSRRALTLNFTKPYMKQQADFLELAGSEFSSSPRVMEVLGYRSRTPKTHSDWYQSGDKRFYHSDQR